MSFAFMPLYTGDYIRDTRHLSMSEHGAYLLMLAYCWDQKGPLPLDMLRVYGICGARSKDEQEAVGRVISDFFVKMEDGYYNERMHREIDRAAMISGKRSAAALTRHGLATRVAVRHGQRLRSARLSAARSISTHSKQEWALMVEFHEDRCSKCGNAETMMIKDHIVPLYQGGSDGIENLQPLCFRCNSAKGADSTDHRKTGWRAHIAHGVQMQAKAHQEVLPPPPQPDPQPPLTLESTTPSGKPDAVAILEFLNAKAGRTFKPVRANLELIEARLKEGATPAECRAVVAKKCRDWKGSDMAVYLRPATLFNRTKFAQYQGELHAVS